MEKDGKSESETGTAIPSDYLLANSIMSTQKIIVCITATVITAYIFIRFSVIGDPDFFKLNNNGTKSDTSSEMYAVVFDAGSTGSRVLVFQFRYVENADNQHGFVVKLTKEFFQAVEPGISHYVYNPHEAAESLKPLLEKTIQSVPPRFYQSTLLIFKATAGLRLLPRVKGDQILNEIRNLFLKSSPFYLPDPEEVEIMGGSEEGIYGWLTINFLLDTLWDDEPNNTVVCIDLGGGSLQITFEIPQGTSAVEMCKERPGETSLMTLGHQFEVHTYSFLGNGLKSAMLRIMGGVEKTEGPAEKKEQSLSSPCFKEGHNFSWYHSGVHYNVTAIGSDVSLLKACQQEVDAFVNEVGILPSPVFDVQELHLFSYFIDVAIWASIIPQNSTHVILTPADFLASAAHHCQPAYFNMTEPFLCMNLLYIHSFLTKGLKLPATRTLHIENQVRGHEASWGLGAALSSLKKVFSLSKLCSSS